ncbi:tRNA glutamyl-Q(34) synthetase GluQRS [Lentisalinibacter sediminis]|uniref:tRNA glutamyl-Q(34) synthetase GluQRS n=1 Tax=Lentisalinibacter sediminis TaxID=2992237 RepID=UPI003863F256
MNADPPRVPGVGRFAPSPTGPLHFGSLLAAVASYLEARVRGEQWLLRIEDIDPPREEAGAGEAIVRCLEVYGFQWDGPVLRQSRNEKRHRAAVERLLADGLAYPCRCTRRVLARTARQGAMGPIYPGTCRDGGGRGARAIRVRTTDEPIAMVDRLQGPIEQRLESELGDFVIRRRDGLVAYQLAVVIDDAVDGVTDVVRGIDLLDSTPRQIHLQRLLGLPTPSYMHIPVAVGADGEKLSKQTGAAPITIEAQAVAPTLCRALAGLRQEPPADLAGASPDAVWEWALANWRPGRLRSLASVPGA